MENTKKLYYFVLICAKNSHRKYISLLTESGGRSVGCALGHGSVKGSALMKAFGLDSETGRAVITCLMPSDKAEALVETLCTEHGFDGPNSGIAFCIPIDSLSF